MRGPALHDVQMEGPTQRRDGSSVSQVDLYQSPTLRRKFTIKARRIGPLTSLCSAGPGSHSRERSVR